MKQDLWTQQLRNKLAEHKVAPPEGLWEDIEAALELQPRRSRFVAWRRWAAAASVAALIAGGGYWLLPSEAPLLSPEAPLSPPEAPLLPPEGGTIALTDKTNEAPSGAVGGAPDKPEAPLLSPEGGTIDPTGKTNEAPSGAVGGAPGAVGGTPDKLMCPPRGATGGLRATRGLRKQPTLSLYAMNGMGAQNSRNGVQMAGALAKQFWETYEQSNVASARANDPIYLAGYEERENHHQPFICGLTLSYPLTERLSLTTGVVYTRLSSDFTQIMLNQQMQQEQTLHYVGVPVGLSYRLWSYKGFRSYLSAGAKADWNVSTHLVTEGVTQELPKDRIQWSLNGGLGLQYDVVPQLGLYAEPGLSWYPDNGSNLKNYFKEKPLNFNVQVGLRLTFTKKKL